MTSGRFGATYREIGTLLRLGAIGHLSDGELLERFIDRRDSGEAAFEALVARHGSMVLGVCRQIVGSHDAAEDAFQATFLVLVRQAGAIRKKESLGPWLHGVARRVSMRARRDAARRRDRERLGFRVVGGEAPDESLTETLRDEIAKLPEKYRTPIVLCDLEGQTHAEAARSLDWPIGTVSGRLSRARALLRSRIARRGLALSTAAIVATLGSEAKAGVSSLLMQKTVAVASKGLSGHVLSRSISALKLALLSPLVQVMAASVGLVVGAAVYRPSMDEIRPAAAQSLASLPAEETRAETPVPRKRIDSEIVQKGGKRRRIENEQDMTALAMAPDGLTLASGGRDARVTLWDLKTGLEKMTLLGHTAAVRSIAFSRDGRLLSSRADDHTMRVWDVPSGGRALSVTWLEPSECPARDLGSESSDSDPGGSGRDRCADGPTRDADGSGA